MANSNQNNQTKCWKYLDHERTTHRPYGVPWRSPFFMAITWKKTHDTLWLFNSLWKITMFKRYINQLSSSIFIHYSFTVHPFLSQELSNILEKDVRMRMNKWYEIPMTSKIIDHPIHSSQSVKGPGDGAVHQLHQPVLLLHLLVADVAVEKFGIQWPYSGVSTIFGMYTNVYIIYIYIYICIYLYILIW